ncbi:hypothetical protein HDV00_002702 [Rhizophlyctis rosea]|nr:hypothetical protein HDV00_002702 [Rhizophlyctis rosea]
MDFSPPVAIVIGATRGIGSEIALTLSKNFHVIIAGRFTPSNPTSQYPGDINSVAASITALGRKATPVQCDVRKTDDIKQLVERAEALGKVEVVVYNAGAIWWGDVKETGLKRFELLQDVNIRGLYATIHYQLPTFLARNSGRFIVVAPPIYSRFFRGKTPYAVGKAMELASTSISISTLWPATAIESAVTTHQQIPSPLLRKPSIFADAVLSIATNPDSQKLNGKCLIDEDYLREVDGVVDFRKYRVDPEHEPPRMMPKKFPSLLVEEQDDRGLTVASGSRRGGIPLSKL